MYKVMIIVLSVFVLPIAKSSVPGTFFWKPRLGLHLAPPLPPTETIHPPTKDNIKEGLVIIIDGYSVGLTILSFVVGFQPATKYKHLSPLHAAFYTNAYRWFLRHLNLLPTWLSGKDRRYVDTHKVWRRRYYYSDKFLPKWMRYLTPWIKTTEWDDEQNEYNEYTRYAQSAFTRHFRYPGKKFNDFASQFDFVPNSGSG